MTADEIRELIRLAVESGIAELEVQRGDDRVRIRPGTGSGQETPFTPQLMRPAVAPTIPSGTAAPSTPVSSFAPPKEKAADSNLLHVKAPIVGTFYESPSPGSPPFVQAGERVQPGKVLCIIESMKLMNEIEAEVEGTIESKLVENGQPVEYGEALFAIRPI
ncbi:MAG: acetyl-CoA carboxylase biotin carboxyl carrier protein [Acidobacteriia bacterium]|nr:acetyl-CoA carboxylase biotin carboxyl carrier protein [Terriglobia bacterium]